MHGKTGTLFCVLCQGIVSYSKGDSRRFTEHMNIEHGANHNLRYILAGSLMSKEERDIVAEIIEERDGNREEVVANKDVSDSILDKAFPLVTANIPSLDAAVEKLEKSIKCSLCNYSCVRNKNLTQHLKKFHKLNKEERESIKESKNNGGKTLGKNADVSETESFPVSIISESDDLALVNVDVELSENKCNVCGLIFDSFSSCLKHQLVHHEEVGSLSKESVSKISTPRDIITESENQLDDKIKCGVCDTFFSSIGNLNRHTKRMHKIDEMFQCQHCDFSTTKERSLKFHKTMKHTENEKFEEKMAVSKTDEIKDESKCGKCEFSSNDEKELKYHKFRNHRHASMKKRSMVVPADSELESQSEEEPEKNFSEVSSDDADLDSSAGNLNESSDIKLEKKNEIIDKSEYFKSRPLNIKPWKGSDDSLLPVENLPRGWSVKSNITPSGRKYMEYVTPDKMFKLRSLVAVVEYVKCSDLYDESEVLALELTLKSDSFKPKVSM